MTAAEPTYHPIRIYTKVDVEQARRIALGEERMPHGASVGRRSIRLVLAAVLGYNLLGWLRGSANCFRGACASAHRFRGCGDFRVWRRCHRRRNTWSSAVAPRETLRIKRTEAPLAMVRRRLAVRLVLAGSWKPRLIR